VQYNVLVVGSVNDIEEHSENENKIFYYIFINEKHCI
jgi:hypothetical protein